MGSQLTKVISLCENRSVWTENQEYYGPIKVTSLWHLLSLYVNEFQLVKFLQYATNSSREDLHLEMNKNLQILPNFT